MFCMCDWVSTVVFWQHHTGDIDLTAANVGMHVDGTCHHDLATEVVFLAYFLVMVRTFDNTTITYIDIHDFAIDLMGRIVDFTAGQFNQHGLHPVSLLVQSL